MLQPLLLRHNSLDGYDVGMKVMKNSLTGEVEGIGPIPENENIVCEVIWGRQSSSPQANSLE